MNTLTSSWVILGLNSNVRVRTELYVSVIRGTVTRLEDHEDHSFYIEKPRWGLGTCVYKLKPPCLGLQLSTTSKFILHESISPFRFLFVLQLLIFPLAPLTNHVNDFLRRFRMFPKVKMEAFLWNDHTYIAILTLSYVWVQLFMKLSHV